tara:strand:- start:57778 stop:58992 length:1215 start_codon:yes stop_codon:yes gene_type:complete
MQLHERLGQAAAWMHSNQPAAIDRLQRWCDQNSWSHDQTNLVAMADMLGEDFAAIGAPLYQARLPSLKLLAADRWQSQPTGPALLWHHRPTAPRRLLLMIHYDTVYPPGSQPDRCERKGQQLVGPGTADAKGGIAVIAMAIEAVLRFDLAPEIGVSVLLNPDEEIGSTASAEIMSRVAPQFDASLLFEPSLPNGSLVAARKGSGNFCLTAHGKSAHAGRNPEQGRNAIVHLATMVPEIVAFADSNDDLLLNIGRIEGGGPLNQVPDQASLQLNARVRDDAAMRMVQTKLGEIAERYTRDHYRVSLVGAFHSPPKQVSPAIASLQKRVESAGKLAGRKILWQNTGGACDGCKLAAMGLANIDTMGISGGGLHSPDEFCDLDSLVPAAHTVAAFITEFNTPEIGKV